MKCLGAQVRSFILVNFGGLFAEDEHEQKPIVQMQALWGLIVVVVVYNKST